MNNTNNAIVHTNPEIILPQLKTPTAFYPFIFLIIFLIISLFLIFFKVKLPTGCIHKSQEEIISNVSIVFFFTLIICCICITLLPNFKDVRKLFEQISNVTYAILYTIFLILFFTMMPPDTINKYAYIITPITVALGAFFFYKSASSNYIDQFNINYERIKTIILLLCLITVFIIFYNSDPGGYIQKYFGFSLLLTILILAFSFVYLIIILTLPHKAKMPEKGDKYSNFLDNFTKFSTYGSITFAMFIATITYLLATYPGGFLNDTTNSAYVIILVLIICILWFTLLGANLFDSPNTIESNKMNVFKHSLLLLFGIIILSLSIFWIVYNVQHLSGSLSVFRFALNVLLVIIVLGFIYKTINVRLPAGNSNKNAFFSLIINTLFYIPCLFSDAFDSLGKFMVGQYNATTMGSILMLLCAILLFIVYYTIPYMTNTLSTQGGKQLVNKPVYTDSIYSLGTYQELTGSDKFNYQYAISFWVFLDASPPNANASYNTYTSLLNFGGKPNVLYNGKLNTLLVTINQSHLKDTTRNSLTDFDENDNRILYKKDKMLLQKWNNIIINYSGGVLDIFLNGELVKSDIGVVPYFTQDNLTIGDENGINGGICNVVYFNKALKSQNVYYIYNAAKNKSPPVLNESNETLMTKNITAVGDSISSTI